jgi:outer membrane biosynthesis protein TonB
MRLVLGVLVGALLLVAGAAVAGAVSVPPAISLPTTVKTPTVKTPTVKTPTVKTPTVKTPTVKTPTVKTPTVKTPTVKTPTVKTPTVKTPTVKTPTVKTPTVKTPTVKTPTVKTPTVPAHSSAPPSKTKTPSPVATVTHAAQSATSRVTQSSARTSSPSRAATPGRTSRSSSSSGSSVVVASSRGSSSSAAAPAGSPSGPQVSQFQSSRGWIGTTGPKKRRTTTLAFVLPHAGRVILTFKQVSPACIGIGHLTVRGHAGLNRYRFAGRVHGRKLVPGTYRVAIRAAKGRVVRRVTLVVVSGSAPSIVELRSLRAANTCTNTTEQAPVVSSFGASDSSVTKSAAGAPGSGLGVAPPIGRNVHRGVLGSSIQEATHAIRPALVALLAMSILLLGTASLPRTAVPGPRVHDALVRHRIELAALGAAALVAVAIAFLVG